MNEKWRDTERKLVEVSRTLGMKPKTAHESMEIADGDWFVKVGSKEICLTKIAQMLEV